MKLWLFSYTPRSRPTIFAELQAKGWLKHLEGVVLYSSWGLLYGQEHWLRQSLDLCEEYNLKAQIHVFCSWPPQDKCPLEPVIPTQLHGRFWHSNPGVNRHVEPSWWHLGFQREWFSWLANRVIIPTRTHAALGGYVIPLFAHGAFENGGRDGWGWYWRQANTSDYLHQWVPQYVEQIVSLFDTLYPQHPEQNEVQFGQLWDIGKIAGGVRALTFQKMRLVGKALGWLGVVRNHDPLTVNEGSLRWAADNMEAKVYATIAHPHAVRSVADAGDIIDMLDGRLGIAPVRLRVFESQVRYFVEAMGEAAN